MSYTVKVRGKIFWKKFHVTNHFEEPSPNGTVRLVLDLADGSQRQVGNCYEREVLVGSDYFEEQTAKDVKRQAEVRVRAEVRATLEGEMAQEAAEKQRQQMFAQLQAQQAQQQSSPMPTIPGPRFTPPQKRA